MPFQSDWASIMGRFLAQYGSVAVVCFSLRNNNELPSSETKLQVNNLPVANLISLLVPPDLWDNVINIKPRAIVTQTHFWRYWQYHVRLFLFDFLILFFSSICHCETDTCACLRHHTKSLLGNQH